MKVGDRVSYHTVCKHVKPLHGKTIRKIERHPTHTLVWVHGLPYPVEPEQLVLHANEEVCQGAPREEVV